MKYWTFTEVKDKVRRDLGLEQEEFVTNTELMGYVNDAIDEAEAEILTLYEDYFLAKPFYLDIVAGQKEYVLPEDIYASKIRGIVYKDGTDIYQINKFRPREDHWEYVELTDEFDDDYYHYVIYNDITDEKPVMHIYPTPTKSITNGFRVRYIRNAATVAATTDKVDIPEFINFIIQYCKVRCYEKEGHPNTQGAAQKLEFYRAQMVSTLTDKNPDGNNTITLDMDFYNETV